jgi:DNA invertase Pin-like site-specific DNA recombinase
LSVGVYIRVSTLDQETGIDSQNAALKTFLQGRGFSDVKWYRDCLSGKDLKRPAFKQMQRDIYNGTIKTVVCWKLDRLSRSLQDGVNVLCDWLKKGVRVVAVSQQFDFTGPVGEMVAGILFAVAQMERENLRENTKRGLLAAKARGVKLGRRPKLFARDIVPLSQQGLCVGAVATRLSVSRQAIYDALEREGVDRKALRQAITA